MSGTDATPAAEAVEPPPAPLRWALWLGALLPLATVGYAVDYVADWRTERAGRTPLERRLSLNGVAFFKPAFVEFVERARLTIPEDARVLVAPRAVELPDGGRVWDDRGRTRWFLYLNHYLYPRQVYVRRPDLASGTLVDYPRWLTHHFVDLEGPDGADLAAAEAAAIEAHGIDWRLTYPLPPPPNPVWMRFLTEGVVLERRGPDGWETVELEPLPQDSPLRDRRPDEAEDEPLRGDEERGA